MSVGKQQAQGSITENETKMVSNVRRAEQTLHGYFNLLIHNNRVAPLYNASTFPFRPRAVIWCLIGSAEAVFFLRVGVLVMTLATRNAGHRCMWVVPLRGVPASVGLAHSVAITPVLLFLSELSAVAMYYDTAVEVDQEADGERNNEAHTAPVEDRRTAILDLLWSLMGRRSHGECRILQLGQALDACVDECRTEGVLEEGDAEEDAHSEREQELDPEEE